MSKNQSLPPNSTVDPYSHLQIVQNPDGSITRLFQLPTIAAAPDKEHLKVLTKDIPINPTHNTWIRIFLPAQALNQNSSSTTKLPLIIYFHCGGFILLRASDSFNHDFCCDLAAQVSAVVVSLEYRLAPEHRLPAAYDDAVEALHFIKGSDDVWLRDFADLSKCFLMGTSAGGNIAYHAGFRASLAVDELEPLKIHGLLLHHPFFGGAKRTESELRLVNNPTLPLSSSDLMWDLALPIGVDRDHKYSNPTVGDGPDNCDPIISFGWRIFIAGCDGDPLIYRQVELAEKLKKKGVEVVAKFGEGDCHAVELVDKSKAEVLFYLLKDFIEQN
ncbi:hypothetical protein UlMin_026753 [Ulmus minor]